MLDPLFEISTSGNIASSPTDRYYKPSGVGRLDGTVLCRWEGPRKCNYDKCTDFVIPEERSFEPPGIMVILQAIGISSAC